MPPEMYFNFIDSPQNAFVVYVYLLHKFVQSFSHGFYVLEWNIKHYFTLPPIEAMINIDDIFQLIYIFIQIVDKDTIIKDKITS